MLTHELKDYVVYRSNREGRVYQCHRLTWEEWMKHDNYRQSRTMLVNNVTQNEARQFCQLTRED